MSGDGHREDQYSQALIDNDSSSLMHELFECVSETRPFVLVLTSVQHEYIFAGASEMHRKQMVNGPRESAPAHERLHLQETRRLSFVHHDKKSTLVKVQVRSAESGVCESRSTGNCAITGRDTMNWNARERERGRGNRRNTFVTLTLAN